MPHPLWKCPTCHLILRNVELPIYCRCLSVDSTGVGLVGLDDSRREQIEQELLDRQRISKEAHVLELGDLTKAALAAVGVTEERVSYWLGGDCGCDERRKKLNDLGNWAARMFSNSLEASKQALQSLLGRTEDVKIRWAYGVTTVPSRYHDLLPRTLKSLAEAGFPAPRLFVDDNRPVPTDLAEYQVTYRSPKVRVFGNWVLSAWELLLRHPEADRFAIFQDDFVTYKNLRKYLEACSYPEKGYWNLYTFPHNVKKDVQGWHLSDQFGRGAVALVFNNETLRTLLAQRHMVDRPLDCHRGWRAVDGGIVTALKKEGWQEFVHTPSLVQHTGLLSSMGNSMHLLADTFRGEDFDAMELLCEAKQTV